MLTNILDSNLAGLKALERTMAKQFLFDNPMTEFYKLPEITTIWTKLDKEGLIFKIVDQPEKGFITHLNDQSRKILNGLNVGLIENHYFFRKITPTPNPFKLFQIQRFRKFKYWISATESTV